MTVVDELNVVTELATVAEVVKVMAEVIEVVAVEVPVDLEVTASN